jgi:hypothetical protein
MDLKQLTIAALTVFSPATEAEIASGATISPATINETFDMAQSGETAIANTPQDIQLERIISDFEKGLEEVRPQAIERFESEDFPDFSIFDSLYTDFNSRINRFREDLRQNSAAMRLDPSAIGERLCIYQEMLEFFKDHSETMKNTLAENGFFINDQGEYFQSLDSEISELAEQNETLKHSLESSGAQHSCPALVSSIHAKPYTA